MNNTKQALFITLYKITVKGKKHYIFPSIDALIDLLAARHATQIKRRWAFRCIKYLEDQGLITRRPRYVKDKDRGYKQIPSLIAFTLAGARKLYSCGLDSAARLAKEIMGWIKGGDKRFPEYKGATVETVAITKKEGFSTLSDIFATLGVATK